MAEASSTFPVTERNRVRRIPKRADYDRDTIYGILDEALICHVGFVMDGQPFVIPTIHARMGDAVVLHGATTSRLLQHVQTGAPLCVTVTLIDGLVLARSVFHHSMNYRSVMIFGAGRLPADESEKAAAFQALTEQIMPGRWQDARQPNEIERKATTAVLIDLNEASAKVRTGGPVDDEEDYDLPVWAGVLPVHTAIGEPQPDDRLPADTPIPDYITQYWRKK